MKSTFWMTAVETEQELVRRERVVNPNYPFHGEIRFCSEHGPDSGVVDVAQCSVCFCPIRREYSEPTTASVRA